MGWGFRSRQSESVSSSDLRARPDDHPGSDKKTEPARIGRGGFRTTVTRINPGLSLRNFPTATRLETRGMIADTKKCATFPLQEGRRHGEGSHRGYHSVRLLQMSGSKLFRENDHSGKPGKPLLPGPTKLPTRPAHQTRIENRKIPGLLPG